MDFAINQAPEAQAFLNRVAALPKQPGVSLDSVLKPSIEKEAELRRLFAQDRKNYHLVNPYVGLISVFEAPEESSIRLTRPRAVKDEDDLSAKYVFPLPAGKRRKDFEPCVSDNLEDFQRNWSIFTEGSLSQLTDWNNVIAAGGSVLGCLLPLSPEDKESRRTIRKFYHSSAYPTSDIDLFLWGLTSEQAEVKINQIYEAVRDSVPWDVTCVRTKHAISIHSQYPYRSVQIVLRLYQSPAEILAGFDVDAACIGYDGSRVLANPRSIVALMRQANTVDMTRRSPSYEVRLAKYASRGFEVFVPDLRRSDVDPTIYERSLNRISGLARLLVLEKLAKPDTHISYLESRRELRSRVRNRTIYTRRIRQRRKGDLKAEEEIAGIDMNDYDVAQMHIPYGPGWTAQRIEKLVYQTDLGINSTFNPKNKDRRLHRHVAFFGTMKECIEDLCGYCPEPKDDEEKVLQEEEDKTYIRGRISFIEDDPGRQSMTGSFNPIDVGEWSELAYLGPTEKLFAAIVAKDRDAVQKLIASGEVDINRRDHVGRTALQVATFCSAEDICADLIDAGARMTARLADGRTALHVAAQVGLSGVIEKMFVRSAENEEKAKEEEESKAAAKDGDGGSDEESEEESDIERPSSDDDWSTEEDEEEKKNESKKEQKEVNEPDADADIPEDNVDTPDILDVNLADWDLAFTPLHYAIVSGSKGCVQALLNAGADAKLATKANNYQAYVIHPLALTTLISDDTRAEEVIDQLIRAGATCAQADEHLLSIFHLLVLSSRTRLVEKILRSDPSAAAAINVPFTNQRIVYPIVSAIASGNYSIAALLIGYGAKVKVTAEDLQKVKNMVPNRRNYSYPSANGKPHELDYLRDVHLPVETAISYRSYLTSLLIKLGAQVSVPVMDYFASGRYQERVRQSILDYVVDQIAILEDNLAKLETEGESGDSPSPQPTQEMRHVKTFAEARRAIKQKVEQFTKEQRNDSSVHASYTEDRAKEEQKKLSDLRRSLAYLRETKNLLESVGAKTYSQIFADFPDAPRPPAPRTPVSKNKEKQTSRTQYQFLSEHYWNRELVPQQLLDEYDGLFEACWTGDSARVEALCLPHKGSKSDKPPLRITVTAKDDTDGGAYTPLSVAILARKWDTARVVLSIAKAQYKPKDDSTNKRLDITSFVLEDEDSDYASTICDSEDEDVDVNDSAPGSITDLAARGSAVQCDIPPKFLLSLSVTSRINREGTQIIPTGPILYQSCHDGDLEAFVCICDMVQHVPDPEEPNLGCLVAAIKSDSPELVDEVIRRSGHGLDLTQLLPSDDTSQPPPNTSNFYLGLTVHGKKRKDLARYIEGNRSGISDKIETPLLWTAVGTNSRKVLEYFSGSGPLAAYQYYAKTKSTDRAEALRVIHDLDKQLPNLLGVTRNKRGENALTAVILTTPQKEKLSLAKKLLSLFPAQKYLQSSIAFTGWSPVHLAVVEDLEPAFFDFLFANGLSPEETDNQGMNIYHFMCRFGRVDLMKHFLEKLPNGVNSLLLKQLTRENEETPLMTAVLCNEHKAVDVLLKSGFAAVKDCLAMRDAKGSMPLHAAVHGGQAKIVSLLIDAAPDSEALYSENGVGETVLEVAWAKYLTYSTRENYPGAYLLRHGSFSAFYDTRFALGTANKTPSNDRKIGTELELLKGVYLNLLRDGKLAANVKLKDALEAFIPYLTEKASSETEIESTEVLAKDQDKSIVDRAETFNLVRAAVSAGPARRHLVQLTDVQRSVRASLATANKKLEQEIGDDYRRKYKFLNGDEIPAEAEAEAREKHDMWKGILGTSWRLRSLLEKNSCQSRYNPNWY